MAKILLIEDDNLLVNMYTKLLANAGYEVVAAQNGLDGFHKIGIFKPDLILLDIMLPKIDGMDLLKRIKGDDDLKRFPVIVLSNMQNSEEMEQAIEIGALKWLVKSELEPKQLVEIVDDLFK